MVDTAKVQERRSLTFSSMQEILDDVEYLASGDPPASTGNWTPAQIMQHLTIVINCSIDGFPAPKVSLPMRLIGRLMRKKALNNPLSPGIRFPKNLQYLEPRTKLTWEEAVDDFRAAMARLDTLTMTHRSPIFGKLSHDQWVQLHCRHAELHFGFIHPE